MAHNTKFQPSWLEKTDVNGYKVSDWAEKVCHDEYSTTCIPCGKSFSTKKGFEKINQHAKTKTHKDNLFKLKSSQLKLVPSQESDQTNQHSNILANNLTSVNKENLKQCKLSLVNKEDAATRAEIYSILEAVAYNLPFRTFEHKKLLYKRMFPTCSTTDSITISRTKASYVLCYGLGPYFKDILLCDLQKPNTYFTLQFDESGNEKNCKELQIRAQYWSESRHLSINRHLETYFIEKGDGDTIFKYLLEALKTNGLSIKNILTLGRDGPNVNKKVFRLFQEKLQKMGCKLLYDIGSCLLHVVNNGFKKGCEEFEVDVPDVLIKIYYFFEDQHLRWQKYLEIQVLKKVPKHELMKHCEVRWLTLGEASDRGIEQHPALHEYFLNYLPKKEPKTIQKTTYLDIKKYLDNKLLKITLTFISYVAKIFTSEFLLKMQKEEPMIHVLYSQLKKLLYLLCSNVIKTDSKVWDKDFLSLKSTELLHKDNLRDLKDIYLSEKVKTELALLKEPYRTFFLKQTQKFFLTTIQYLLDKVPGIKTLKYFECLQPENIKKSNSIRYIQKIATMLPLVDIDIDLLSQEWQLLQVDVEVSFTLKEDERIDSYWSNIFALKSPPCFRYTVLAKVVKAALSLTHSSSSVERGFSDSHDILTDNRANMSLRTLNALLNAKNGLKNWNSMPHEVPMTNELLKMCRSAHRAYQSVLENEKKVAEEKRKQREIDLEKEKIAHQEMLETKNKVTSLKSLEAELQQEETIYKNKVKESESMQKVLKSAIAKGEETSKAVLMQLVSGEQNLRQSEKEQKKKVDDLRKKIEKRKKTIFDSLVHRKLNFDS